MAKDAVTLIKLDHKRIQGLFSDFEKAGERAYKTKQRLVDRMNQELEVHTEIEEELFYPRLAERAAKQGEKLIHVAEEEHHVARVILGELRDMEPRDEQYDAKVIVLMENVRHHIQEEESQLLPQAQRLMGKEGLTELGAQLASRKQELMGSNGRQRARR
jgi:hemerythrin-like domain-containing protein